MEIWKQIQGFENYEVSNRGNIRNVTTGKILKPEITHKGYFRISLSTNGVKIKKRVHRLVAEAFIENPYNKPQINHKDGNKINNDISNLEWCNNSENMKHAWQNGMIDKDLSIKNLKITRKPINQYTYDGKLIATYLSGKHAEIVTGINSRKISDCCYGRRKSSGGYRWAFAN